MASRLQFQKRVLVFGAVLASVLWMVTVSFAPRAAKWMCRPSLRRSVG